MESFQYRKETTEEPAKDLHRLSTRVRRDKWEWLQTERGAIMKEDRFILDRRKRFCTIIMKRSRLPREVVGVLFLETFKVRLVGALNNLIYFKMPLLMEGCWTITKNIL